ncbi:MAG TPA: ADOP family duplicated permease [Vicinamibacterales bacterium]|nr:ADOP family duplicated permease [Vicinamibacterales bacterium]
MTPPRFVRFAAWLLVRGVPAARRLELLDDVRQDVDERRPRVGRWSAEVWGLRELASLGRAYRANARRMRSTRSGDAALHVMRMAWRGVRRAPALTALIVVMLGAGIGAATAIFSLVDVLLVRPAGGVADSGRLISVERTGGTGAIDVFSYPDYLDLREDAASDVDLAAFRRAAFDVRADQSERVRGALVTGNYFTILGVHADLGRTLLPSDDNVSVAVISHACWQELFGARPDVAGRTIGINGHPFTIVGVLPAAFAGTYPGQPDSVWVPFSAQPIVMPRMSRGVLANRNSRWVQIMGRLREHASATSAAARLAAAGQRIAQTFPGDHAAGTVTLRSGLGLATDDRVQITQLLSVLGAAAALLLLIACGNAANLLLARAQDRQREAEIRRALGASSARLAAELLSEGAILAAASGALGVWLAPQVVAWLTGVAGSGYGIAPNTLTVDWRAGAFAVGTSVLITIVFTLVPLRGIVATRAHGALRAGGRTASARRTVARSALVALQVAFSAVLAVGAGLGLRTMRSIDAVRPGYATSGLVTADYALDLHAYTPERSTDFFQRLASALRSEPGIGIISWSTAVPPVLYGGRRSVFHLGQAPSQQELQRHEATLGVRADDAVVGPRFFETMGIALRSGREFTEYDRAGAPAVAIVNRALAERLWPGQEAIGQFLEAPPYSGAIPPPMQVIGVAEDTRHESLLSDAHRPVLYLPFLQNPDTRATLVVQASSAGVVAAALRHHGPTIDRDVPATRIQDIADYDAATLWEQRSVASAFGVFAVFGLALAAIGVYAALAHDVASRRRELAVRMALGASLPGVAGLVVRDALRVAFVGALAGTALALAASGRLRGVLFGVSPRDPITLVAAPLALLLLAVLASAIPARRAATADPIEALRIE